MGKNYSFTTEKIMVCETCKKFFMVSVSKNKENFMKTTDEFTKCILCRYPRNENIRKYSKARFRGYRPRYSKQYFIGGYDVNGICRKHPETVY